MLGNKAVGQMLNEESPQCLLLMPPTEEFVPVRELVSSSLKEVGIEPILALTIRLPDGSTAESVRQATKLADIIIADLTGSYPNIMYEVGYAQALKRTVLPIVRSGPGRVPTAMEGQIFVVYDPANPEKFRNDIQFWTQRYLERKKRARA